MVDNQNSLSSRLWGLWETERLTGRTVSRTLCGEVEIATLTVTEARSRLYALVQHARFEREPILITGKHGNAVLVSEDDWRAIQETLHLLSIPGMRESIREGLQTPVDECETEPGW